MSDTKSQPERSMEEIIASIGRIIAEDGKTPGGRRAPPVAKDDILELTEAVDENGRARPIRAAGGAPAGGAAPSVDEPTKPIVRIEPEGPRGAGISDPAASAGRILSPAASEAAAAAFGPLGAVPQARRGAEELAIGGAGRTLEDVVRESLQPLLRNWLDQNLPVIVERLVREEIARVTGEAGLR